jgi:hypothetical protein
MKGIPNKLKAEVLEEKIDTENHFLPAISSN